MPLRGAGDINAPLAVGAPDGPLCAVSTLPNALPGGNDWRQDRYALFPFLHPSPQVVPGYIAGDSGSFRFLEGYEYLVADAVMVEARHSDKELPKLPAFLDALYPVF